MVRVRSRRKPASSSAITGARSQLLQSFDEAKLMRRGLAYERLGDTDRATREFKLVVAIWQSADQPLMTFVQQAQAGLARLRGAVEGRS